jgi:hypothetical protein
VTNEAPSFSRNSELWPGHRDFFVALLLQAAEAASGQAALEGLFPKADADPEPDIPALFNGWEFVDTDSRAAPGPWRPLDPNELGQIQPRSEVR